MGLSTERNEDLSEEDIDAMFEAGAQSGVLVQTERDLFENVWRLDQSKVGSLMTPRSDIIFIDVTVSAIENIDKILANPSQNLLICKEDLEHVNSIISQLKLEEYRNIQLQKLSDGNLQKAFIGRALAQNSPIIILDEPTTHLDEENKIIILKLLRDLAKNHNKIILFSSHDWRLAKEFADKIWFINDQNLQEGLAEDILLKNNLLTNPRLFTINEEFVSPEIIAPFLEKEMLYSALQKNFKRDLSGFKIEFQGAFWEIFYQNNRFSCQSIDEILLSIRNCL